MDNCPIFLKPKGFTRIEVLIVLVVLSLLAVLTWNNFRLSQYKARDLQRKADFHQIFNALEAYRSFHGFYPAAETDEGGKIMACGCSDKQPTVCDWQTDDRKGGEFCDGSKIVYLQELRGDPKGNPSYCYWSDGTSFKIYARLENKSDPEIKGPYACGGDLARYDKYNFGLSSSNINL